MPKPSLRRFAAIVVAAGTLAACGDGGGGGAAEAPPSETGLHVVATVDPIADLVERVAGDRVGVTSIVPEGVDGHTFEPRSSEVRALSDADLVVLPSLQLNLAVTDIVLGSRIGELQYLDLTESTLPQSELVFTDTHSHGGGAAHGHTINAHTWTNPRYARAFVQTIGRALAEMDPDGTEGYNQRASALMGEIDDLDAAILDAIETIPEENRKLVVYHDSWTYFGRNYGMPVIGAIQARDFSEPSAAEFAAMVEQIRAEGVPAFFGSEVFPSDVLEAVAEESGAEYVGDLSDDRLPGSNGDAEHSYIGMMANNARLIVESLGGDASALDGLPGSSA